MSKYILREMLQNVNPDLSKYAPNICKPTLSKTGKREMARKYIRSESWKLDWTANFDSEYKSNPKCSKCKKDALPVGRNFRHCKTGKDWIELEEKVKNGSIDLQKDFRKYPREGVNTLIGNPKYDKIYEERWIKRNNCVKVFLEVYNMIDKESIFIYVIIGFVMYVCLKIYSESDVYNLKCIISDVDGERYCVRDRMQIQSAADLLAKVTKKMKDLVAYCADKYPDDENVQRLVQKFNPTKISETLPTSEYTAYSENKGEKLAFCLNKEKNGTKLIDVNTLTFVAIHELAHIMTVSEGHKQEFWQNFKFLLEQSKAAGIYDPVDYKNNPEPYCGMDITDNPYYDLK